MPTAATHERPTPTQRRPPDHVDVLIVGAGVSGIGIACHLRREHPDRSIAILERRDAIGGTWDLFRYPGIRCDSDMYTFGYSFRPWPSDEVITDGESIRTYLRDTAAEYGVDEDIVFGQRVEHARWSTAEARWSLDVVDEHTDETRVVTGDMLVAATGYYDYDTGHAPHFPGQEQFTGRIVHPQFWPDDLDHAGKRVVVIGSGATAVTLVPAMAEDAAHVTMVQRSPGYVVSLPEVDPVSRQLKRVLPDEFVSDLTRIRNVGLQLLLYNACQRFPSLMRRVILAGVRRQVGDAVDMRHFSPDYDPWDQRLCVVPDGDLFRALRSGRASMVTDAVDAFTPTGVRTASGEEIDADVIVTATGLKVQLLGGVDAEIDGEPVDPTDRLTYRSMMVSGVPNFVLVFGYVNVSWTRKVDLVGHFLNRLLAEMDRQDVRQVTPRGEDAAVADEPFVGLMANYVQRALDRMPLQGRHVPWRNTQNLPVDWLTTHLAPIDDGHLEFSQPRPAGIGASRGGPSPLTRAVTAPARFAMRRLAS